MDDTTEEAWRKGQVAGEAGEPATSNPYPTGNARRSDWAGGWRDGVEHFARHAESVDLLRRALEP